MVVIWIIYLCFYFVEASDNQLETDGDAVRKLSSQQDARLSLQIFRLFPVSREVFWLVCLGFLEVVLSFC